MSDPRVDAAWLAGSFGRGVEDAWSDLDLHVVVRDDALAEFLAERPLLYARLGQTILVQPDMPAHSAPENGRFQLALFAGGVELDLSIVPTSEAVRPDRLRLLLDRVGVPGVPGQVLDHGVWRDGISDRLTFFWAMAPIAVKYAARGATLQAVRMLDYLTETTIDIWNLLYGNDRDQLPVNLTSAPRNTALMAQLPHIGEEVGAEDVLDAILHLSTVMASWHQDITVRGVETPDAMPQAIAALGALARSQIASRRAL